MAKFALLLSGLALAASLPATAVLAEEVPTAKVEFGDLDLRSDAGVEVLDRRLKGTISRMCGDRPGGGWIVALAAKRCVAATLADITPQRDAVIRLARSGKPPQVARLEVKATIRAN